MTTKENNTAKTNFIQQDEDDEEEVQSIDAQS